MKKLLVASSALVAAAPAFANDVTLSGSVSGSFTTGDFTGGTLAGTGCAAVPSNVMTTTSAECSGVALNLGFGVAYAGENSGGNISFSLGGSSTASAVVSNTAATASGFTSGSSGTRVLALNNDVTVSGWNAYAQTAFGKFNIGTSTGGSYNDGQVSVTGVSNVDGASGVTAEVNAPAMTYSNDFGGTSVAVTWGAMADDYMVSLGGDMSGLAYGLDYSDDGSYALSLGYDAGVVAVGVETNDRGASALGITGSFGGVSFGIGGSSDGESGLDLGYSANGWDLGLGVASDESYTVTAGGSVGGMGLSVSYEDSGDYDLSLAVTDALTISTDEGGDITFAISTSF